MKRRSILAMLGMAPVAATGIKPDTYAKTAAVNPIPEAWVPQSVDCPDAEPTAGSFDPERHAWERYQATIWRRDNLKDRYSPIGPMDEHFGAMRSWSATHKRIRSIEAVRRFHDEQEVTNAERGWKRAIIEATAPSWVRRFL